MKDYIKDLKQCVRRLFKAEELLDVFLNSAGRDATFFESLDLKGVNPDYKHPVLDYGDDERECFYMVCGYPMTLPKDFTKFSANEIRNIMIDQRDILRNMAGMVDKSRWLGEKNYLSYKPRKSRYWTGRLIG